ncbi:MAG: hypothetical protein IPI62_03515 [Bacteroidetes bacterium]|nr:hypothetical protein [Bacteroidota bacterium]
MKKHYQHILGIDVSKKTLDLSLVIDRDKQNVVYEQFENNAKSIRRIGLWLKSTILNGIGYWSVWNSQEFIIAQCCNFARLKKLQFG